MSEGRRHVAVSYGIHEVWGSFGDRRVKLSTLAISRVAIRKDILEGKLRSLDITNGDRSEIQHELDLIRNRWEIERNKSGIGAIKIPLVTSTKWIQIQARENIGWSDWQSMDRWKQWVLLEHVCFLPRRPVRGGTEEQQGNLNIEKYYRSLGVWKKKIEIFAK